jgi:sugar phosphate permease
MKQINVKGATARRSSIQSADAIEAAAEEAVPFLNAHEVDTRPCNDAAYCEREEPAEIESPTIPKDDTHEDQNGGRTYTQIFLLCGAAVAETAAFFSIFPFVNEMIERMNGLDEVDVGFWAGLIESSFALVQMVLMIFYGKMSDRLGRKPVLVFSLAGLSIFTILFGMSRTLWQMILFRCLAGSCAGSAVTVRTMLSEGCSKEKQGRAFSWYMFARNFGIIFGLFVGILDLPRNLSR